MKVCEILTFSSCALPELGRASATNVNKLTNFEYASLFSTRLQQKMYQICDKFFRQELIYSYDGSSDKTYEDIRDQPKLN